MRLRYVCITIMVFLVLCLLSACSGEADSLDSSASSASLNIPGGVSSASVSNSAGSVSSAGVSSSFSLDPSASVYTIFTYNVEKFDRGVGPGNAARPNGTKTYFTEIATLLKAKNVAVIGLAEVSDANPGEADNFAAALSAISYPMPYYHLSSRSDGYNCIGYYSRYPVSDVSEIGKSGTAVNWGGARTIYRYKVTFPGGHDVWFYSCHLKSGQDSTSINKRVDEATGLGNYIRANHNVKTEYIVVMGDMNTMNALDWPNTMPPSNDNSANGGFDSERRPTGSPTGCTVSLLEHKNQSDSAAWFTSLTRESIYPWTTQPGWANSSPLDHIVLSPALYNNHYVAGSAARVITGTLAQSPSDHYPVECQIYF